MNEQKYNHKEAFCLMYYECEKCGNLERLWNSRDGFTPFIIGCKKCGGESKHVRWELDRCVSDYEPKSGERIFVDMTKEKAKEIAIDIIKKTSRVVSDDDFNRLIESIWHDGETPYIMTVE